VQIVIALVQFIDTSFLRAVPPLVELVAV